MPTIVRRYVASVLPTGGEGARTVRIGQLGEMTLKPGARPRRFLATEEFDCHRVAFDWRARFPLLGPVSLHVRDRYDGSEGRLEVRVLALPVQRQRGPDLARGEALRYLAEIAWVPHAILANAELEWRELDARAVEVATHARGDRVAVQLTFNDAGEIVQTLAERPRAEEGGAVRPWIGEFRDYQSFEGIRIPSHGEVRWELPEGPFTYWRGTITSLELCD